MYKKKLYTGKFCANPFSSHYCFPFLGGFFLFSVFYVLLALA